MDSSFCILYEADVCQCTSHKTSWFGFFIPYLVKVFVGIMKSHLPQKNLLVVPILRLWRIVIVVWVVFGRHVNFVTFIKSKILIVMLSLSAYSSLGCKFSFKDSLVQEWGKAFIYCNSDSCLIFSASLEVWLSALSPT